MNSLWHFMTGLTLLDVVNSVIGLGIVVYLIYVADKMKQTTSHFYRCSLVSLAMVVLAYVLWPFFGEWSEWMDTILLAAVGSYLLADRRLRHQIEQAELVKATP